MTSRRSTSLLGLPGIIAVGILCFCLSFYVYAFLPAQKALKAVQAQHTRLTDIPKSRPPQPQINNDDTEQNIASPVEMIRKLNDIASANGIDIDRANYQVSTHDRLTSYDISLPLQISYPKLRSFIDALMGVHSLTMESLTIERSGRADSTVTTTLKLSYDITR